MLPLVGYADRLSVGPGETIEFKVSSIAEEPYEAGLVRSVCGDPNPAGPGIKIKEIAAAFAGTYPSRDQPVHLGSYVRVPDVAGLRGLESFTLAATIWPTTPRKGGQGIIAKTDPETGAGFSLMIDDGSAAAMLGDGAGNRASVSVDKPMRGRAWYRVWARYDSAAGALNVGQEPLTPAYRVDDAGRAAAAVNFSPALDTPAPLLIAALGGSPVTGHFNGKIERPSLIGEALDDRTAIEAAAGRWTSDIIAAWDFSENISGTRIVDTGPHGAHGEIINLPARGMMGSTWSGREMCWRHAPEEYGAIHFHDDDLYDCGWETDFAFTVPPDMRSGVYAARLRCGEFEDMVPFFVRPSRGTTQSDVVVLVPTFTYIVYANHARHKTDAAYRRRAAEWGARPWTPDDHPDYGLSTYNRHSDGSGICYSSRLRPIITMRPGFVTFVDQRGSGLRHFPADTHLFDWLEAMGHGYDVVTDEDLHEEGGALIKPYQAVLTTSHPEYHTAETLDALKDYTEGGGRLIYLGGNGFYWRVARHRELDGVLEIRRAEGGIRAWAAEPGEYYNSFDGAYGGLWRRNNRYPQRICGVGFSAQGLFEGSYYRRRRAADDPRAAWIFAGVDDEILGDFGLSGGGAAGFELDRADFTLGTPGHALVLASSEAHSGSFILVPEEQLSHLRTLPGDPPEQLIRADMVYYETPNEGAVFSVGSITFCGSLSHNGYDNNISRILNNVLTRFRAR